MLSSAFQICEPPFDLNPDSRFLYLNRTYREALASLLYRIQTGSGFMALIAQPGMGKTMLLYHLMERLRPIADTALIFQTQCTSQGLLQQLAQEFECTTDFTDPIRMTHDLKAYLTKAASQGRRCVLLIDEAHNLEPEVLETVRLLSNFETPRRKLLQIILSGQTELDDIFSRPDLRQLRQRLSCLIHLDKLTPEEVVFYVCHRLTTAGYSCDVSDVFTTDALVRISNLSGGIPRTINNICANALSLCFALDFDQVDADIIDEVAADLGLSEGVTSKASRNLLAELESAATEADNQVRTAIQTACARIKEDSLTVRASNVTPTSEESLTIDTVEPPDHFEDCVQSELSTKDTTISMAGENTQYMSDLHQKMPSAGALKQQTSEHTPAVGWEHRHRDWRNVIRAFMFGGGAFLVFLCIAAQSQPLTAFEHTKPAQVLMSAGREVLALACPIVKRALLQQNDLPDLTAVPPLDANADQPPKIMHVAESISTRTQR